MNTILQHITMKLLVQISQMQMQTLIFILLVLDTGKEDFILILAYRYTDLEEFDFTLSSSGNQ